jgi:hypothetical protein
LGEGAFGKVYKGELTGFLGGMSALVAIKTLKPGKKKYYVYSYIFMGIY